MKGWHNPMIRQTNIGVPKFKPLFSPPHPLKDPSSSCHRPLAIGSTVSQYCHRPLVGSRRKRPDMKEPFVREKLISFYAVWLNHNAAGNESPLLLFHYSVQSCYQALNIASLYIPFLAARFKERNGPFWTSGVYFTLLFIKGPGPLSFPFLLPLAPSPWVIATTHI